MKKYKKSYNTFTKKYKFDIINKKGVKSKAVFQKKNRSFDIYSVFVKIVPVFGGSGNTVRNGFVAHPFKS